MLKVDYKVCYGEKGNDLYNIQIDHRREVKKKEGYGEGRWKVTKILKKICRLDDQIREK